MSNTDADNSETIRHYEIGYLLAPTVPEDEVATIEAALHTQITDADGEVKAAATPEMRELSYEIEIKDETGKRQFGRGQFGWVQFSLSSEAVDAIDSSFKQTPDVIRHLLITIDPEDVFTEEDEEKEVQEA